MKGGTGILIDSNNESAFNDFMNNSTFEYFSRGGNGLIFVATLNPGVVSPYQHLDASTYGSPVTKLIIKICFILDRITGPTNIGLYPMLYDEFTNEVNIQTDVFLKTMNYLQPLCPAIVYAGILEPISTNVVGRIIEQSIAVLKSKPMIPTDHDAVKLLNKIHTYFQRKKINKIGIIAMEFADNYKMVKTEMSTNPKYTTDSNKLENTISLYNIARYMVIELAVKTGYNHGDYHISNMLINLTKNTYFKGIHGEPLLIDFGFTVKLSQQTIEKIKEFYKEGKYNDILNTICKTPRSDGLMLNSPEFDRFYGYACSPQLLSSIKTNNTQIGQMIKLKQEAIDDIIKRFDLERKQNNLPYLPLSNKIKNKMYIGMIDDIVPLKDNIKKAKVELKNKQIIENNPTPYVFPYASLPPEVEKNNEVINEVNKNEVINEVNKNDVNKNEVTHTDEQIVAGYKKRCPNGTQKNRKTEQCESSRKATPKLATPKLVTLSKAVGKRCPKGTRKNKKTGECELK